MLSPSTLARSVAIALLTACVVACRIAARSETHLIPQGYTGPVVILYLASGGEGVSGPDSNPAVHQIGRDGVLRVNDSAPSAGFVDIKYFYIAADGSRSEIPYEADTNAIQAFAAVDGMTRGGDDFPEASVRWAAYVVGIPTATEDWISLRDRAVDQAVQSLFDEQYRRRDDANRDFRSRGLGADQKS